jgi:peptide chain release factor 2
MIFTELKSAVKQMREKIARGMECLHIPEKEKEMAVLRAQTEETNFWDDPKNAREVSKQLSALEKIVHRWQEIAGNTEALDEMLEMIEEHSPEAKEMEEEFLALEKKYNDAEMDLLFGGEFDAGDAIIEINAGAGGTEAQDWAGMLLRMYLRFAERHDFKSEILEKTDGAEAGVKSVMIEIAGEQAFGLLRGEKGTHRLVRQSPFNAKNLRQTSFAGVIVTPVIKNVGDEVAIEEKDLRIDTFRASGAGGQHVNKTDSAVRIIHIPTKIVVECQNQRSQHQNKEKAMEILKAKLLAKKREEEEAKAMEIRGEVTDAAWGTQIRNYVLHPYKMVKDLRTEHESGNPDYVLDGDLDDFIRAYLEWDAARKG